jgi:formylglycine-generating enzyme required for sulfatase activity
MVRIPAGSIQVRGIEVPVPALWVAKTELEWKAFDIWAFRLDLPEAVIASGEYDAEARPSRPYGAPDRGFGHDGYPAIGMTFQAAKNFCAWLAEQTGRPFRLPNEAEWEYAARAGAESEPTDLDSVSWNWDNGDDKTQPVGRLAPNAWGLHDMLGNVAEWAVDLEGQPVVCGGSFYDKKEDIRFTRREYQSPDWQMRDPQNPKSAWWLSDGPFVGFRVVFEQ